MHYKKIKSGDTIIEFHNNWLGVETVIINGQVVSKKASILGANHYFTIMEDGHPANYMLTTKTNEHLLVLIDLRRNGKIVFENVQLQYGTTQKAVKNKFKKAGIQKLVSYDIDEAINDLKQGLNINADDPEIFFYLACCYSNQEKAKEGFECLKKAVENKLQNVEMILNHEMLAYLRMQDAFEEFLGSNFTKYDESKLTDSNNPEQE